MGLIQAQVMVNAPREKVFEMARHVEDYPAFMPDVEEIEILERDLEKGIARVRWVGKVEVGSIRKKVRWVEEEIWDPKELRGEFKLIEGDYKHYFGEWEFIEMPKGQTLLTLDVDFDLGLPLIGPLINKLLDKIMLTNCQSMLEAIKRRVENV